MKTEHLFRISLALFVFITVTFNFLGEQKVDAQKSGQHVSNEVLVRFKEEIDEGTKESIRNNLGATLIKTIKGIRVEHWKLPEDVTVEEALEFLNSLEAVDQYPDREKLIFFMLTSKIHHFLENYTKAYKNADIGIQCAKTMEGCLEKVDIHLKNALMAGLFFPTEQQSDEEILFLLMPIRLM